MITIRHHHTGAVLLELDRTNLSGASLRSASLRGASLRSADLSGASLRGADLSGADLSSANLTGANLTRANLTRANLTRANLSGASLRGADLSDANLTEIRSDLHAVLATARAEVPALLEAVRAGRIDGSTYAGECSCLVGTIATARGVAVSSLNRLSSRPAERWFLALSPGDTPATSQVAAITERWIVEWIATSAEVTP